VTDPTWNVPDAGRTFLPSWNFDRMWHVPRDAPHSEVPPHVPSLLLEDGSALLLEGGGRLLLE
jgi:hypothetical protein